MLCGYFKINCKRYPPFLADTPKQTCFKIVRYNQTLEIPNNVMSKEAEDLIKKFLTGAKNRIGYNSVDEIKNHKFFKGIDWDTIRYYYN
jgi:hypothetical protein